MNYYNQLMEEDGIEIYALLQAGKSKVFIAQRLSRNISTIYREIKRNMGKRAYRATREKAISHLRKRQKMPSQVAKYFKHPKFAYAASSFILPG